MKSTKVDPLRWAIGGALVGAGVTFVQIKHGWAGEMILANISQILGGAAGGALLASVFALIRNAFIRRK